MRALLTALVLGGALAAPGGLAAEQPMDIERVRQLLAAGRLAEARESARALAAQGNAQARETLASMLLRGIGGDADRHEAMGWLCLRVHAADGGDGVAQALWLLAEYFRTGGGLPGRRYNDGERTREDPVKAFFWFSVMAAQDRYYPVAVADAARLGRLGADTLARQLTLGERQGVERRLETWDPGRTPASPEACLDLPRL